MNIYLKAEKIIQNRHDLAEQNAYATLQQTLKNPQFKQVYEAEQSCKIDLAKKEYFGLDVKADKKKLEEIQKIKEGFLHSLGMSSQSLQPQYTCPICHDTGKTDNGRCQCFQKIVSQLLLEESGIRNRTLPSFETTKLNCFEEPYRENIKYLYQTAQQFIDQIYTTKKQFFVICGLTGTGKTYLAECMVQKAIAQYVPTYYVSSFTFNQEMLQYHCAPLEEKQDIMDKYLNPELLVIDDLGTESILKNVTLEYLYQVLNDRFTSQKKTIITTNLFPDDILERYEERIFSRLTNQKDAIFVEMQANNLRHKK